MRGFRQFACMAALASSLMRPSAGAQSQPLGDAYRQSFERWKAELVEDRKQNWLPLAGLFWLKSGQNTFGTDKSNALLLPEGTAPSYGGSFDLQSSDVSLTVLPGVSASIDGKSVVAARLDPDVSGHPTLVELGSLRMHVIRRGDRVGIRVKDLKSPVVEKYGGPIFYPLNAEYRIAADWMPADGKKTVLVPNVLGMVTPTPVAGEARFMLEGTEVRLSAVGGDPAEGLSFIFSDLTRKTETYPAGRFLDSGPVKDGKVVLDFNRAYNPPCSVTAYATCPLPPKENQLAVSIPAGEKYDHSQKHP